ncbi:hypothetical protein PMAYCL1PPCAC_11077, partial [Pristionchus mayeri]
SLLSLLSSVSGSYCGESNPPVNRIIGGNYAPPGKWPWQVELIFLRSPTEEGLCGGSIIAPRWILTAAHCFDSAIKIHKIFYGSVETDRSNKTAIALNYTVHEDWDSNPYKNFPNDIALIELEEPIKFDLSVTPVCLPSENATIPKDAQVIAAGFGTANDRNTSERGLPTRLKETVLPLIPNDVCNQRWQQLQPSEDLRDTQMCGGSYGHGTGEGDSGGPVVIYSQSKQWFQVGVISLGPKEGLEFDTAPVIYTNVAK